MHRCPQARMCTPPHRPRQVGRLHGVLAPPRAPPPTHAPSLSVAPAAAPPAGLHSLPGAARLPGARAVPEPHVPRCLQAPHRCVPACGALHVRCRHARRAALPLAAHRPPAVLQRPLVPPERRSLPAAAELPAPMLSGSATEAMGRGQCWGGNAGGAMLGGQCWGGQCWGGAMLGGQCWGGNAGGGQCWGGDAGGAMLGGRCWGGDAGGAMQGGRCRGGQCWGGRCWGGGDAGGGDAGGAMLGGQCWGGNAGGGNAAGPQCLSGPTETAPPVPVPAHRPTTTAGDLSGADLDFKAAEDAADDAERRTMARDSRM